MTRITLSSPPDSAPGMSRANSVGVIEGGNETMPWNPFPATAKLRAVIVRMLESRAARTFRAERTATIRKPITASTVPGRCRSPRVTKVAGLAATMPAFFNAMIARNRPIPAVMAMRMERGIPSTMIARSPVSVTMRKQRPDMNTAPRAAGQAKPRPCTTT